MAVSPTFYKTKDKSTKIKVIVNCLSPTVYPQCNWRAVGGFIVRCTLYIISAFCLLTSAF